MPELHELRLGIPAFLKIEIRPAVNCLDDNLLTPFPGEKDEWDCACCTDFFEKFNPVHRWHLVIRDNGIIGLFSHLFNTFTGGDGSID